MINIDSEIESVSEAVSALGHRFAKAATFGNNTDEMLFNMVRLNAFLRTMERYVDTCSCAALKIMILSGAGDELTLTPSTTEVEPCLSDSEVCALVEKALYLASRV